MADQGQEQVICGSQFRRSPSARGLSCETDSRAPFLASRGFEVTREVIRRHVGDEGSMVAACILCVYIVCWDNSNKIPRYFVNTYYVQSTVLGANQYKFSSQSCQWPAVWFRASPLILVCLISPTCKVGITLLSTYLPHRGVVRIHGVTFGALNLLEELRRKHLFFSIVLPTCGDSRAKEFRVRPAAATVPRQSRADETRAEAQLGLGPRSFLWSCLNRTLGRREPWTCPPSSSTAANSLQFCVSAEVFLSLPERTLEGCPLSTPER